MHTLRHTFATRWIESGMKPKTVQKILGHANISMTMDLYVHVTEDEKEKEMQKFEQMYGSVWKKSGVVIGVNNRKKLL